MADPLIPQSWLDVLLPTAKALAAGGGAAGVLAALSRLLPSGDRRLDDARDRRTSDGALIEQLREERVQLVAEIRQLRGDLIERDEKYITCREEKAKAIADLSIKTAELEELRTNVGLGRGLTPEQIAILEPPGVHEEQVNNLRRYSKPNV